jgi:hypothetical protein
MAARSLALPLPQAAPQILLPPSIHPALLACPSRPRRRLRVACLVMPANVVAGFMLRHALPALWEPQLQQLLGG